MKPRSVPTMTTDEEAEAFLDQDLSGLDFSAFKPLTWESEPKTARVNMRLSETLLEALKQRAADRGIPYQRLIREVLEKSEPISERRAKLPGDDQREVSQYVGRRIMHRRWMVGVTQAQLDKIVGVTLKTIHKFEKGERDISAAKLLRVSQALSVPVSFFFEGIERASQTEDHARQHSGDLLADREALELVRSYYSIPEGQRQRLFELANALKGAA